jgi:hypothetical protein
MRDGKIYDIIGPKAITLKVQLASLGVPENASVWNDPGKQNS